MFAEDMEMFMMVENIFQKTNEFKKYNIPRRGCHEKIHKAKIHNIKCKICKNNFIAKQKTASHCSKKCYQKFRRRKCASLLSITNV